ncbi:MAG: cytochrome B6 [Thermaerobacter sp.]|nr:cytochrome B6 [Thermaerobacter sp.]
MRRYETDPAAYSQTRFDLVKEAVIGGGIAALLIVAAALVFGVPYVKPLTIQKVATTQPVLFLRTAARELGGTSTIAQYGPPYNHGTGSVQSLGPLRPQMLLGVTTPINTSELDVLKPLSMAMPLDPALRPTIALWRGASHAQQQTWVQAYLAALSAATAHRNTVHVPQAADGPVPAMLSALRKLAAGGLMSGAIDRSTPVYGYDVAPSLLFLQGAALQQMAGRYDLLGGEWGIMHDEYSYPGPWWLTPYSALYQIPPYSTSSSGDALAAYTMLLALVVLLALPFIPGLRDLPRRLRVYRIVWRDWYKAEERQAEPHSTDTSPQGRDAS